MSSTGSRYGAAAFCAALAALAVLPMAPELMLAVQAHSDLKYIGPICYYEAIVSFLLLFPALVLPGLVSRIWIALAGAIMGLSTLFVGFYSACFGARWNLTAHAALMQTNHRQASEFMANFVTWRILLWMAILAAAFCAAIVIALRSAPPRRAFRWSLVCLGAAASVYGIDHNIRYGGMLIHRLRLSPTKSLRYVEPSYAKFHPVTLLAMSHFNYYTTNQFYLKQDRYIARHQEELSGATPIPGAICPKTVVVVVGESANRRHWSLYGYPKETTPRLDAMAKELVVFPDVVATCASTLFSIHDMFTTPGEDLPTFSVFSGAGYNTHWFSSQFNQGGGDLQLNALVLSCNERVYLNGVYDQNLLPFVARALDQPGPQMIFTQLFGSHIRYVDRYPGKFAVFAPRDDGGPLRSSYDNSIYYTDSVLADLIGMLKARHESSCLLYVSDHGEDVMDSRPDKYLFRDESLATDPMYEVPFFVWMSPEYRRDNPAFAAEVDGARNRKFQNRALYQSLLDLARLRHPIYDPTRSLFSPSYVARMRIVGIPGRVYRGKAAVIPQR